MKEEKVIGKKESFFIIVALGILSTIGPFSIDMYLPGFKNIAQEFGTDINHVGYSLSSYFIGVSVGQLVFGPLLDRFGRLIPLYIGLLLFVLSSILLAFSWDVESLIAIRVFQALGSCGGMVAARALVRDIFPVHRIANIFSYIMLFIALSPLFAPTLGGFVTAHLGWRAVFIFLAFLGVFGIVSVFLWLKVKNIPNRHISLKPIDILSGYWQVLKVPQFTTYAMMTAVSQAGLFAYVSGSPFVFIKLYDVSEQKFGLIFAFIGLGMTAAGQLNILLLKRFRSENIIFFASCLQVCAGLLFVIGSLAHVLNLYSTIAIIWLYMSSQGFIMPNGSSLSMIPFTKTAGAASALMGALQLGFGALTSAIVSSLFASSSLPLALAMFACGLGGLAILLLGRKRMVGNNHQEGNPV